ncbi:TonB family protein [bacterium]|nr:TonB family protein [bacterium]
MKPAHLIASFFGHLVFLVLLGTATSVFKQAPPPPPDTIRISFGELPHAGGRRRAGRGAEVSPAPREEPKPKPAVPVAKPKETPKPAPKTPAKETPKEAPKPVATKASEAVKPVTKAEATKAPEKIVPPPGVAGGTGTAPTGVKESVPAPGTAEEGPGAQSVGMGGSVQARGDLGAGDSYLGLVQSKIGRRWQPSASSTAGRAVLEAIVAFRISADGEIESPEIFQSSGLSVFDREALRAVVEANPLPAPPVRFRSAGLSIQFSFTYRR